MECFISLRVASGKSVSEWSRGITGGSEKWWKADASWGRPGIGSWLWHLLAMRASIKGI